MWPANRSGRLRTAPQAFQVIPPMLGAFVGAPTLARELETAFRFTWTQGFVRPARRDARRVVAGGVLDRGHCRTGDPSSRSRHVRHTRRVEWTCGRAGDFPAPALLGADRFEDAEPALQRLGDESPMDEGRKASQPRHGRPSPAADRRNRDLTGPFVGAAGLVLPDPSRNGCVASPPPRGP